MIPFFSSLRNRMLLLAALVFLPAFGLAIYGDYVQRDLEIHEAQDNVLRLVHLVAANQDRLIESPHQLLSALANLNAIQQHDPDFCNSFLTDIVDQSDSIGSIAVVDLNGDVWCSSTPIKTPVNLSDRSYFQRAIQTRGLAVSDYQIGRISGVPVINVAIPLYDLTGKLQGVLSASIKLAWLNQFVSDVHLVTGSFLSITDASQTILVRFPDPDSWVGKPMTVTALLHSFQTQSDRGIVETMEADGVPRLYAFAPLDGELKEAGFHAIIGIPTVVAYANSDAAHNRNLLSLALVTGLAMLAVWLIGEWTIARRVRGLTQATRELTAGNLNARTGQKYGINELSELARRFDEMAQTIQQRENERARSEEQLRQWADIFQNTSLGVFIVESNSQTLDLINPAFARMNGYSVDELKGKPILDIVEATSRDELIAWTSAMHDRRESHSTVQVKFVRKDGSVFPVLLDVTMAYDETRNARYRIITAQDITLLKRAEEDLRRQAEELAIITRVSREIAVVPNLQTTLASIARLAAEIFQSDASGVYLLGGDNKFRFASSFGLSENFVQTLNTNGIAIGQGAVGRAALEQNPVQISNVEADPSYTFRDLTLAEGFRAVIAAPMMRKGESTGGIVLWQRQPRNFSPQEQSFLQAIAQQCVNAVENARLFEAEREQREFAEALRDITAALNGTLRFDKVLNRIMDNVGRVAPYDVADIMLVENGVARVVCCRGYAERGIEAWLLAKRFPVSEFTNIRQGIASPEPLLISDTRAFPGWVNLPESNWIRSVVEVPIRFEDQVVGFINLDNALPNFFTATQCSRLMVLADQAALALENARLLAEAQDRSNQFAALYETTSDLAAQQDLPALLHTVVERAMKILKAATGDLYLYDPKRGDLVPIAAIGFENPAGLRMKLGEGMAGRVAQTRQPMIVDNYQTWEHRSPWYKDLAFSAVVQAPMVFSGELIGVLSISELPPSFRKFTEADMRVLSLFAGQAASAVHNARLLEETRQRVNQFAALYETMHDLGAQQDLSALLEAIVERADNLLKPATVVMMMYDTTAHDLQLVAARNSPLPIGARMKLSEGIVGRVAQMRESVIVNDYSTSGQRPSAMSNAPISAVMGVPMLYRGEVMGVLLLSESDPARKFTEADEHLLSLFAGLVAGAIHNTRLLQETHARAEELALLYDAGLALNSVLEPRVQLEFLLKIALRALRAECAEFFRFSAVHQQIHLEVRIGQPGQFEQVQTSLSTVLNDEHSLVAAVCRNRLPLYLPDVNADPRWKAINPDTRSALWVPIEHENKLLGVFGVLSTRLNAFAPEDERLSTLFANQAAVAMENARLFDETQQRANRLAVLNNVARAVSQTLNLDELLEIVYRQVNAVLKPDAFCIALYDATTQELDYRILIDEGIRSRPKRLSVAVGFSSRVIATHRSLLIGDALLVEEPPPASLWGTMKPARSWLGAPMRLGGTILGIINAQAYTPNVYSEEDEQLLVTIADQVAVALQNARLFEETTARLIALETVNRISTALREAQDVEEMLPRLLDETLAALNTTAGAISLYDAERNELYQAVTRGWFNHTPSRAPTNDGIAGQVFRDGKPFVTSEFRVDPVTSDLARAHIPATWGGAIVPIRAAQDIIGVLAASVQSPRQIEPAQVHLLTTIAEMAGNAIQRARLYQQTEQRLQRLNALHIIDTAISASQDLRLVLNILLDQTTTQLKVDAADILTLNPYDQTLQFCQGHGLKQDATTQTRQHLGDGYSGRAVLERRIIRIPNLTLAAGDRRIEKMALAGWAAYFGVPLVSKGRVCGVLEIFHRAALDPDADWLGYLEILAGQAAIAIDNSTLFENLQRSNVDLSLAYDATIEGWARTLQMRTESAESHTDRVLDMTLRLARALGLSDTEIVQIRRGVFLHDVGEMGIPDSILAKPGALTEDDWKIVRQHPQYAYDLLKPIDYMRLALDIPYCHHEKWDGTGYPRGLKNTEIPLAARIFAVVDAWDALRSARPYREAWSDDQARQYIQAQSGLAFDPLVVATFLKLLDAE